MKYLYTLTSTCEDNYYEQFLLSAASLKLNIHDAVIYLLCDSKTKQTLCGKRREYEKFISNIINVDAPKDFTQTEVSRWVKTSMRRLVQGDFLFIDCDTIITDDLSSVDGLNIILGACLDCHSLLDSHFNRETFISSDKKLGFNSYLSKKHFNSGVIYCKDTPLTHKYFDRWHELWLFSRSKNILRDQPSFNMAIFENKEFFSELNGIWNCQIPFNSIPYLPESKIIHYFASNKSYVSPYIPASSHVLEIIKQTGVITDDIYELLKKPRSAFIPESRLIAGNDINTINSDLFKFINYLSVRSPSIFKMLDNICSAFKKTAKKKIVKTGNIQ